MPRFAHPSVEATAFLRQKTGSTVLECYTFIDPDRPEKSFFAVRTANNLIRVDFAEIDYDPSSYASLLEGLYRAIYE
ncbi:hypothetical protein B5M42_018050 [Paenibacillus athensensis]|uniref:Uncharacterized protein n=1 Tax=Paenibacillus athensensis TaxID=1967502 RepID=A0A4Y8Q1K9_9BACL|nr:hypothetical protein [Paenibacillus athensensis]MCD1260707.1 hypothetical protein [Paenibacillus athensensis]